MANYEARGPYTLMFWLETENNNKAPKSPNISTEQRQVRLRGLQRASQVRGALARGHTNSLCPTSAALHTQPRQWDNRWKHSSCTTAASSAGRPAETLSTSVSTELGQLNPLIQHSISSTKAKEPYRARELSWFIFNSLETYCTSPAHLHRREKNKTKQICMKRALQSRHRAFPFHYSSKPTSQWNSRNDYRRSSVKLLE